MRQMGLENLSLGVTGLEMKKEQFSPLARGLLPIFRTAKVSVILPTLNEAQNLPLVFPFMPMNWIDEVILVDGRSTDGTVEIAKQLLPSIKIVLEQKRGKGAALLAGYKAASGDILVVIDADGSHDPREIPRFVLPLLEGADMVKGSRFAPGGGTTDMPAYRKAGNGGFVLVSNLLFGTNFTDLCYGYHAFWRHCLESLDLTNMTGFEIDTSLYLQAVRKKLKVVEVPSFEGYRFYGSGKLKTVPDGWRVLKTIFREYHARFKVRQNGLTMGLRGSRPSFDTSSSSTPTNPAYFSSDRLTTDNGVGLPFFSWLSEFVQVGLDIHELLQRILRLTLQVVDATSGSIILLDKGGDIKMAYMAYEGDVHYSSSENLTDVLQQGLAGWVVKNRQFALVMSTSYDPRWLPRSWEGNGHGSRSALAIPLMVNDDVVGVLSLARPQARQFTQQDLIILQGIVIDA